MHLSGQQHQQQQQQQAYDQLIGRLTSLSEDQLIVCISLC